MKIKVRYVITLMLAVLVGYMVYSTNYINKMEYRTIAWECLSQDLNFKETFQNSWKLSDIGVTNINKEDSIVRRNFWDKSNYYLNQLNGGSTVYVKFRAVTFNDGEAVIVYINPFTKQIVGVNEIIKSERRID